MKKSVALTTMLLFMMGVLSAAEAGPTRLRIPWEDIKQLLGIKPDQVRLSWDEYKTLVSRTSQQNFPTHIESNGDVILSQDHFRQLLQQLIPPNFVESPFVFTRGRTEATLTRKNIVVTSILYLHLNNNQKKWVDIELPLPETAFRSALMDDRPALVSFKNGLVVISTRDQGDHVVRLTYSVPRTGLKDDQNATFPVVRTPLTSVSAKIPEQNIDIRVDQALHSRSEFQEGVTVVKAILPPTNAVRLSWTPVLPEASKGAAKVYAQTNYHVSIEDDVMRVHCLIDLQTIQNSIKLIRLQLPNDYSVVSVHGEHTGDWSLQGEDSPVLTIPFQVAQKGQSSIKVTLEKIFSDKKITLGFPGLSVLGAVREHGYIGVELRGSAQVILSENTTNVERVDVQHLPQQLSSTSRRPMLFGFQYLRRPFQVFLSIERHDNVSLLNTVIDNVEGKTWITEDGKKIHQVHLWVRNSNKQLLEFGLPEGASLWSVFVDQQPSKPSMNEHQKLLIPLNRSSGEQAFPVEVIYFEEQSALGLAGQMKLQFPTVEMMMNDWSWSVVLPKEYRYQSLGRDIDFVGYEIYDENQVGLGIGKAKELAQPQSKPAPLTETSQVANAPSQEGQEVGDDIAKDERVDSGNLKAPLGRISSADQKTFGKKAKKMADIGVLPIRVKIPISGQTWRFSKSMVPEQTALSVGFIFLSAGTFAWLMLLLGLFLALAVFNVRQVRQFISGGHHDR